MSWMDSNSMFGNTSGLAGMLGDYSAIRSGSYGKLMKSYYGEQSSSISRGSSSSRSKNVLDEIIEERRNPKESKEVSAANSKLSTSVSTFKNALGTLQSENTYKDTQNGLDARSKVENALKSYVSAYNDAVTTAKKSTNMNMTSNVAGAMGATKESVEALGELGITLNHDGTLAFDVKKFKTIELSTVKDAFDGNAALSYGSKIASRLNRIADSATSSGKIDSSTTTVATVSNSKSLMESIESLKGTDLYTTKNNAGDAVFNRDGVKAELGKFIEFYNKTIEAAKKSGISGVNSNLTTLLQKTAQYTKSLAEIGVTVTSEGKLSLNKSVFDNAAQDKIKTNLTSYASSIETNARLVNYYSTTQNNSTSGYSATGSYTNTSDIVSQLYGQI
ncbi:MAG TPA: hypothetical protein DCR12_00580 [Lachnospiraceae bacterium]|nr:hypothetical protein [Lachnospiraceae bacterium]